MNRPIIALATPPIKGALAIIRLSGEGVFELTEKLFPKEINRSRRDLYFGPLKDLNGNVIDLVVVLAYPGPNSMTGEDVIEISCHGSMVIVEQIVEQFMALGATYATRGEFSSRAFYNGKMDLVEAESVNDLINATTVEAKNLALLSLTGETSKRVGPLKEEIAALLAQLEVGIDYPEYEDVEEATQETIINACTRIRARISSLISEGNDGRIIKEGINVALVGVPNVGKSSLLNALLNEEKAIVSPIPGTTRDVVEGDISIQGIRVHLLDTAGIHASENEIEALGIDRSLSSISKADLVIFVRDQEDKYTPEEEEIRAQIGDKTTIEIINKSDINAAKPTDKIHVSALKKDIEPLKKAIFESLHLGEDAFKTPSLSSARELSLLRSIDMDLEEAMEEAKSGATPDLLSVPLQAAYNKARELLGEDPTHDLSDEIFSRFCVGK